MWLLIIIIFSAPMTVKEIHIAETYWVEKTCVKRLEQALKVGFPKELNMGCVFFGEVSKAYGN